MANVVSLQLAVGQVLGLDVFIPTCQQNNWVQVVWREPKYFFLNILKNKEKVPHTRNPVLIPILLDGVLALGH